MTVWLIISGLVRAILKKEIKMDFEEGIVVGPSVNDEKGPEPVKTEEVVMDLTLDLLGGVLLPMWIGTT